VKRWERWGLNASALTVSVSGFAYLWMKYFLSSSDPFAIVNHPWQVPMLSLHVVTSPVFILIVGIVFQSHVTKKLRASRMPNRKTGYGSLGMFAAMVLSGYLLQVAADPTWLRALVAVHVASGIVFSVTYLAHLLISFRLVRRQNTAMRGVA
jgi:dipeptide/tripeptide permease